MALIDLIGEVGETRPGRAIPRKRKGGRDAELSRIFSWLQDKCGLSEKQALYSLIELLNTHPDSKKEWKDATLKTIIHRTRHR